MSQDHSNSEQALALVGKMSFVEQEQLFQDLRFRRERYRYEFAHEINQWAENRIHGDRKFPLGLSVVAFILIPIVFGVSEFQLLANAPAVGESLHQLIGPKLSCFVFLIMISNTAMSFAFSGLFGSALEDRLAIIRNNMILYSMGQELHQPLTGNDSISKLDQLFRCVISNPGKNQDQPSAN